MLLTAYRLSVRAALRLAGGHAERLELDPDTTLLYHRFGPPDGEPWVLLHGLASTALSWHSAFPRLRHDCHILAPELSALGGTRCPKGGLAIADGVRAVERLIETELDGRAVTLAGNSLGGWMAVRLALARPELVQRLVLVDAGGYLHQDWDRIEDLVTVTEPGHVDDLYRALFSHVSLPMHLGRRAVFRAFSSAPVHGILSKLAESDVYDDHDLAKIHQPTALIWGERDGLFPMTTAERMADALPNAVLYTLPRAAHAVHWEAPRRMADAIDDFRRRWPAPLLPRRESNGWRAPSI